MPRFPLLLLVWGLLAGAGVARAEPRSYALVVGSNRGGEGQPALRYASRDAQRFASLLVELGSTCYARETLGFRDDPFGLKR